MFKQKNSSSSQTGKSFTVPSLINHRGQAGVNVILTHQREGFDPLCMVPSD